MRERDETGAHAQDGEGLDLEVGRVVTNERLVDGDLAVVFFVDIEISERSSQWCRMKGHC
jgi:hypothetical protein